MGVLVVFAGNVTHPDPDKDRRGCHKKFDPISAFEDGEVDGKKMGLPRFYHIHVPGVPASALRALCEPQDEDDDGNPFFDNLGSAEPEPATYRRHRWNLDGLNPGMLNLLEKDGELTLPPGQIKQFLKRKRDGAEYDGLDNYI